VTTIPPHRDEPHATSADPLHSVQPVSTDPLQELVRRSVVGLGDALRHGLAKATSGAGAQPAPAVIRPLCAFCKSERTWWIDDDGKPVCEPCSAVRGGCIYAGPVCKRCESQTDYATADGTPLCLVCRRPGEQLLLDGVQLSEAEILHYAQRLLDERRRMTEWFASAKNRRPVQPLLPPEVRQRTEFLRPNGSGSESRRPTPACTTCRRGCTFLADLDRAIASWWEKNSRRTPLRADICRKLTFEKGHCYGRLKQHGLTTENWIPYVQQFRVTSPAERPH
jgi:hypothetical protein